MCNRQMGAGEHQLVASFAARYGRPPTEAEFAQEYIERWLSYIGFNVQVLSLDSNDLDVIHQSLFDPHTNLLDDTVLVVGNAPSAVFTAGHLRWVARSLDSKFDAGGDQLFMMGDTIPLALAGEGPATHQNPFSALGSVARNYLSLRRAIGNL